MRIKKYFLATRPMFLTLTVVAWLLGISGVSASGYSLPPFLTSATLIALLLVHAGANVINDYADEKNGTDAINASAIRPFTGGSLFIQNRIITRRETIGLAGCLFVSAAIFGLWIAQYSTSAILIVGSVGFTLGWSYSMQPLQLMSRGWGETVIILAWLLAVIGTDLVLRGEFSWIPFYIGISFALLVGNVLFMNEFPDAVSDAQSGKKTLVVRLGFDRARFIYGFVIIAAYGLLTFLVIFEKLPPLALIATAAIIPSALAWRHLLSHASRPSRLRPALVLSIIAAHVQGLLLACALFL